MLALMQLDEVELKLIGLVGLAESEQLEVVAARLALAAGAVEVARAGCDDVALLIVELKEDEVEVEEDKFEDDEEEEDEDDGAEETEDDPETDLSFFLGRYL